MNTENELVAKVVAGDKSASYKFYLAYHRLVAAICHRYFRGEDVPELVQEAFIRIYCNLCHYTPSPRGVQPWLCTVVINLCLTEVRRVRRKREVLRAEVEAGEHVEMPDVFFWHDLLAATAHLPPHLVETVRLQAIGLSCTEIAEKQGISVGTVRTRLFRARAYFS